MNSEQFCEKWHRAEEAFSQLLENSHQSHRCQTSKTIDVDRKAQRTKNRLKYFRKIDKTQNGDLKKFRKRRKMVLKNAQRGTFW